MNIITIFLQKLNSLKRLNMAAFSLETGKQKEKKFGTKPMEDNFFCRFSFSVYQMISDERCTRVQNPVNRFLEVFSPKNCKGVHVFWKFLTLILLNFFIQVFGKKKLLGVLLYNPNFSNDNPLPLCAFMNSV